MDITIHIMIILAHHKNHRLVMTPFITGLRVTNPTFPTYPTFPTCPTYPTYPP